MSWDSETLKAVTRLEHVQKNLADRYVGRERAARLLVLAAVCREHMLLLGPPGTAKTDLVGRFARLVRAGRFSYLLSRFTEPAEIFGPLDYTLFQQGEYRVRTEGMLPEAQFAFLDELFQASSAILNTLLALLNERVFHNGARPVPVPLISLFGAASEPPEDPALRAFDDRFLLRLWVRPVARTHLSELLELGWDRELERLAGFNASAENPDAEQVTPLVTDPQTLPSLHRALRQVRMDAVLPEYTDLVRDLLAEGVTLSDRRVVRGQKLVAGAALLRRTRVAEPCDLWPLAHVWTEPGDEATVARVVADRIGPAGGSGLEPERGAAEIVAVAQSRAAVLGRRPGQSVDAKRVLSTLQDLHQLDQELRRNHPGDTAARHRMNEIRQSVAELMRETA